MGYNIFLDDIRTVDVIYKNSQPKFIVLRDYNSFVSHIKENGMPDFISFDNDLGEDKNGNLFPDGYACAKWLVYESDLDLSNLLFRVHSSNPVAKVQIESLLKNYIRHYKNEKLTFEQAKLSAPSLSITPREVSDKIEKDIIDGKCAVDFGNLKDLNY